MPKENAPPSGPKSEREKRDQRDGMWPIRKPDLQCLYTHQMYKEDEEEWSVSNRVVCVFVSFPADNKRKPAESMAEGSIFARLLCNLKNANGSNDVAGRRHHNKAARVALTYTSIWLCHLFSLGRFSPAAVG